MGQQDNRVRILLVENEGSTIQAVRWVLEDDPQFDYLGYVSSRAQVADF